MNLSTLEISQTTNPSKFLLESDTETGVYNKVGRIVTGEFMDEVTGTPSHILGKPCYDGIQLFCLYSDRVETWQRPDLKASPSRVFNWSLQGRVYTTAWESWETFDFSDVTTLEEGVAYSVLEQRTDYGTDYNYFGFDWEFQKRGVVNQFFMYSEAHAIEMRWILDIKESELAENRQGTDYGIPYNTGTVADYPVTTIKYDGDEVTPTVIPATPTTGWSRFIWKFSRLTPCEDRDGRTAKQLFAQDAGISVR